jgi:alkylation response protein AidB-like acyl-CoA dehydrogenase
VRPPPARRADTVVAKLLPASSGTADQNKPLAAKMAIGKTPAAIALTEPGGGSDMQAMRTTTRHVGEQYLIRSGSKALRSKARYSQLIALMCKPTLPPQPARTWPTSCLSKRGPGFLLSRDLPKLAIKQARACLARYIGPAGNALMLRALAPGPASAAGHNCNDHRRERGYSASGVKRVL